MEYNIPEVTVLEMVPMMISQLIDARENLEKVDHQKVGAPTKGCSLVQITLC